MRGDRGPGLLAAQTCCHDPRLLHDLGEGGGKDWQHGAEAIADGGDDTGDLGLMVNPSSAPASCDASAPSGRPCAAVTNGS